MVEKLVQHKHCRECGRAIPSKELYCSEECESSHKTTLRKKKNQLLLLYVVSVVILLMVLLLSWGWLG